jgi:hypothetical protein
MEYKCKKCNKNYSSYQSLWIHNKKFHNLPSTNINLTSTNINQISTNKKYNCKYCNKSYNIIQSRWKHEKICKIKDNEIARLKAEIEQLKNTKSNTNNKIITITIIPIQTVITIPIMEPSTT